jgi:putative ABC transport system permease protein
LNLHYVLNELRHHQHRTLVNVLGIGIGIALFVSINAVSTAYHDAAALPFKNLGADLVVQRPEIRAVDAARSPTSMQGVRLPFSNQLLRAADLEQLRRTEGVGSMASALLLWEFEKGGFRTIMGVDLAQPSLGPVKVKEWLKEGRFPRQEGEVVLEKHYAKFQHARIGGTFTVAGRSFTVVGLLEIREGSQLASANLYLTLRDAQALIAEPTAVNVAYVHLTNPSMMSAVKRDIASRFAGASITSSDSSLELMGGISRISDQFSLLASLIALGGAVFLIIKSMLATLVERSREIGILKAVGWTEKDVRKQLMTEVLLQAVLGGLLGLLMGYGGAYVLSFLSVPVATTWQANLLPAFAKDSVAVTGSVRLPVRISATLTATSFALALGAGALASFAMARRTSRMKPADVLRQC